MVEDFIIDVGRRGYQVLAIEPKAFDLLAHLIANRDRVVSKDDLIEAVWAGRIVSESALTTCINAARVAVGDSGEAQRLIKTLPRRGFRFVGEVRHPPEPGTNTVKPALALPDKPSIAVLPFTNMSGDPAQDYFADGITDDIITELSRFSELFVIARNSSFQFKGRSVDVREVGRELGVRYVLEGSVRRVSDRVRIGAQLVDTAEGGHRWAERYDRELHDVFAVQDEVARTISTILVAHVAKAESERTLNKPPAKWQAYDYFLQAAQAFASYNQQFTAESLHETQRLLERSIALDPNYARAHALLARTHTSAWSQPLDGDYLNPTALDRAHALALRALRVDPNLPQAHASLGAALLWKAQHDASIAAFERACALNPNFTDWRFATAFVYAGEFSRAIDAARLHMRSDPFYEPIAPGWVGLAHYMMKNYQGAIPYLRETASRAPNARAGHLWLAATYAQLGCVTEARAEAAEVLRIEPKWTIEGTSKLVNRFKFPEHSEHFFDGLRKAGLPE